MPMISRQEMRFWDAFVLLTRSRNMNGVIPVSEIAAYLDCVGETDSEVRRNWLTILAAMDDAYLEETNPKKKKGAANEPSA